MGKKHPYYTKSMRTNFPGFPNTVGFVAFSCTMRNCWANPCISHMIKYTIGWRSNGKKAPILWEMYEYFPDFSLPWVFLLHFPHCGKLMGKSMHFPYDDIGYFFPVKNALGRCQPAGTWTSSSKIL